MASSEQWTLLEQRMTKLGITAESLKENFILGTGSGGQKVNKTSSCVQLRWKAFEVKCQQSRSRETNRYLAREELCRRLEGKRKRSVRKMNRRQVRPDE